MGTNHTVHHNNNIRWSSSGSSSESSKDRFTPPKIQRSKTFLDRVKIDWEASGICHVQLDRPTKLNALDLPMFQALVQVGDVLRQDPSIRVVILSGSGKGFCSGLHVPAMVQETKKDYYNPTSLLQQLLERTNSDQTPANLVQQVGYQWRQMPIPVICAIHGVCFGGGLQIALGADFRFATKGARLSIMEGKWGLIPDMSATITLRELGIPIDVVKEWTMTGQIISGTEAAHYGLVTRCVDAPLDEARRVAQLLLDKSPDACALSKQLYQATWTAVPEDYCLKVETDLQKQLLLSWNQIAATGRAFGWKIPYFQRKTT